MTLVMEMRMHGLPMSVKNFEENGLHKMSHPQREGKS